MLRPTAVQLDHHLHDPEPGHSRRAWLRGAAGLLLASPVLADLAALRATAEDAMGPFYPLALPSDQDHDLTQLRGHSQRAAGRLLHVSGRVMTPRGEPIANATMDVWQANAAGRYSHPGDTSGAPLDPHFQGFARLRTGSDGSYRFKTVQPGLYGPRTRHIHFDVRGRATRLITQMYFEGEAANDTDILLRQQLPDDRKTLIARPGTPSATQERDALVVQWDIVLAFG